MAESEAMRRAMELDRDFELRMRLSDVETLADVLRDDPSRWHALKQGGPAAVRAAIRERRAA